MDLNGLLTLMGLITAAYALLSTERRLSLSLRFGILEMILLIETVIAVHYYLFFDYFKKYGLAMDWMLTEAITPKDISYIIVLMTTLLLLSKVKWGKIPGFRIFKFQELVEQLNKVDTHEVLITLLDKNLDYLVKVYKNRSFFQRIRKWLTITEYEDIVEIMGKNLGTDENSQHDKIQRKLKYKKLLKRMFFWIPFLIPNSDKKISAATNILRTTFLNEEFVNSIVRIYPYFGIRTFESDIREFKEFSGLYLSKLFENTDSILYFEIRDNQSIFLNRYRIEKSNKLLRALFSNCKIAKSLSVWRPIGEGVINHLDRLYRKKGADEYNFELGYFDRDFLKYPIPIGIRFFDIMVTEALFQNIGWHMWLYYFPRFTEKICRNFEPKVSGKDLQLEFPTKYSSILYSIIATQCDWVSRIHDLPNEQSNVQLESVACSHQNNNIIKSSILSLTQCLYIISETKTIPAHLMKTIFRKAVSQYFDLRASEKNHIAKYADSFLNCMFSGGDQFKMSENYMKILLLSVLEYENYEECAIAKKLFNDIFTHIERTFKYDRYEDLETISDRFGFSIEKTNGIVYIKAKSSPYRYELQF